MAQKLQGRVLRQLRNRKKIIGTGLRPRLNVFRSNKHISVQIINDETHHTLVATSTKTLGLNNNSIEEAKIVGAEIAKLAREAGITQVVFDRAGYKYHGKVEALANAAREHGLDF